MGFELITPNPKLKLMDQVREVLRVNHYAIRTEQERGSNHRLELQVGSGYSFGRLPIMSQGMVRSYHGMVRFGG